MVSGDPDSWDIPFYVIGSVVIIIGIKNWFCVPEHPKDKGIIIEEEADIFKTEE